MENVEIITSAVTHRAVDPGDPLIEPPADERRAGEGGWTLCGDVLYAQPSRIVRRLCGDCCSLDGVHPDGCGVVLDTTSDPDRTVLAEVAITRAGSGFGWRVLAPGTTAAELVGEAPSATEAVWRAVDAIRGADGTASGVVAILGLEAGLVAYVPLWAVPAYEHLEWRRLPLA